MTFDPTLEYLPSAGSEAAFIAPPQPAGPAPAPPLAGQIEGITFDQDGANSGFVHIPPDPHGAVGPNHVVSVVNTSIEWHTKAGVQQNSQRLGRNATTAVGSFFATLNPGQRVFDPKVVYDQYNQRFVVVALDRTDTSRGDAANTSRILVAVSDDSDPNGTWHFTAINSMLNVGGADRWADYPGLAVDSQVIYITNNMFTFGTSPTFGGSRLWIIPKAPFYAGGAATFTVHDPSTAVGGLPTNGFTLQPAHMYGAAPGTTGTFLVSSGYVDGATDFLSVVRVDNALATPTFANQYINVGDIHANVANGYNVPQLGATAPTIDGGNSRMQNAVWRSNALWTTNTILPTAGVDTGTPTAHWYRINTASLAALTLGDQGNVGGEQIAAQTRTFYPAVTVDSNGNMAIGFAASGPNIHPGAYYTGRLSTAAAGTTQLPGVLAAGVDDYFRAFGGTAARDNRWGDYSGIAIDPANDTTFWVFNQYAIAGGSVDPDFPTEDGRWATRWGNFTLTSTAPTSVDLENSATYDTGQFSNDNVTNRDNSSAAKNLRFIVSGTTPGATVTIYAGAMVLGSAIAPAGTQTTVTTNGTFDLIDATHTITARQTEIERIESPGATTAVTVDTQRPVATFDAVGDPLTDKITSSLTSATIRFKNQISQADEQGIYNFVRDDWRLSVNGTTNLVTTSQTLSGSNGVWQLSGLTTGGSSAPTASPGAYTLSIVDQGGTISDLAGNTLLGVPVPETWNQSLTYTYPGSGTGVPVIIRYGNGATTTEMGTKVTAGSVTLEGQVGATPPVVVKSGAGTLVIDNVSDKTIPITFNAKEGWTEFVVNPGTSTTRNWTVYVSGNVDFKAPGGHHLKGLIVTGDGFARFSTGPNVLSTLMIGDAPNMMVSGDAGSLIVHDTVDPGQPVSFMVGNETLGYTTISGTATGVVTVVDDHSGPTPTLRKFGSGTLQLSTISSKTVPLNFINEEGKTEFHTNAGDPALGNGVSWSVTVQELTASGSSSVEFHTTQNLLALDIATGAEATLIQNGSRALAVNSLNIAPGGKLDMQDNDLIVHAAAGTRDAVFAQLYVWIVTGFNGGTWDGTGITSSVARDNVNYDTALGIVKNSDTQYSTFTGQGVNSDSILVKYTYYGDVDLSGSVTSDDQTTFSNNYGSTYAFWADGDFDYNNNVNADDLTIFANNMGKSGL